MYGQGIHYPPIKSRVFNWILFMGKIVHLVGMLSPYWAVFSIGHQGIWLVCIDPVGCSSVYSGDFVLAAWLRAVQAMAILGTMVSLFGMICVIVFLRTGNRTLLTPGAAGAVVAGVLVIIGVIIFGAEFSSTATSASSLSWAFYLEAVSGVIMLAAGIGQFTQVLRPSQ